MIDNSDFLLQTARVLLLAAERGTVREILVGTRIRERRTLPAKCTTAATVVPLEVVTYVGKALATEDPCGRKYWE